MEHLVFSKVFNKISHDIYVDKIGSESDDNIVRWVVFKQNSQKTLVFPSMPFPGALSGALSLVLFSSTIFDKALLSSDTKLKATANTLVIESKIL